MIFNAFGKTKKVLEMEERKKVDEEGGVIDTQNEEDHWKVLGSKQKKGTLFASGGDTDGETALELLIKLGQRMEKMETKLDELCSIEK